MCLGGGARRRGKGSGMARGRMVSILGSSFGRISKGGGAPRRCSPIRMCWSRSGVSCSFSMMAFWTSSGS
jgi:hypothetical protein